MTDFASALRGMGPANFLYADGDMLFAHGHRRVHDDGAIRPPGLCSLVRHCPAENPVFQSAGVTVRAADQHVLLFASVPLTSEGWIPLAEGEVVAVRGAEILFASR